MKINEVSFIGHSLCSLFRVTWSSSLALWGLLSFTTRIAPCVHGSLDSNQNKSLVESVSPWQTTSHPVSITQAFVLRSVSWPRNRYRGQDSGPCLSCMIFVTYYSRSQQWILIYLIWILFSVLGSEFRALSMLGKCSTPELYAQPFLSSYFETRSH